MKSLTLGIAIAAALAGSPALAAPAAMYDWSGMYVGVGGSLGSMSVEASHGSLSPPDTPGTSFTGNGAMFDIFGGITTAQDGTFYGLEGELSFGSISGTNSPLTVPSLTVNTIGSLSGIIGANMDGFTLYGRAGPAFAMGSATEDHGGGAEGSSAIHFGGVAAVGLEHPVSDTLKIRGEVSYGLFLPATYEFPEDAVHTHDIGFSVARAGVSLVWSMQ